MPSFNIANDASTAYANNHNYFIYFQHIPTGMVSQFKAFITDFEDTYESTWNDVSVYGRMDPICTFEGTKREINLSFDVVAGDLREAKYNLEHSRRLIKSLYPVYEEIGSGVYSATSIQAPPLVRIRLANLIVGNTGPGLAGGLVGKLGPLSYKPDFEAGVFQGIDQILPKVNKFSCTFTVLHTEDLGFNTSGQPRGSVNYPYVTTDAGEYGYVPPVSPPGANTVAASEPVADPESLMSMPPEESGLAYDESNEINYSDDEFGAGGFTPAPEFFKESAEEEILMSGV